MTLAYAEPVEQPVFPLRWALNALAVFAVATIAERASIWVMLGTMIDRRGGFELEFRSIVDFMLTPLAAAALLWILLREQRIAERACTRRLVALAALQVALAMISIIYWSLTVLPVVWRSRGGWHDAVIWQTELIHVRLLPVAWPLMIVIFAHRRGRGLPTARGAAAALTIWSISTWACAAFATASLWHRLGWRAFSTEHYGYTIAPAWTFILLPVVTIGLAFWLGAVPVRLRIVACLIAAALWLAAALLRAWYDERMYSVRAGRFGELTNLPNLSGIVAELISDLILWQIAPIALLLFLARRPSHQVD